ncbi:MAG: hypothetical protein GX139_00850 [Armatimonadetes bacterium]|nr:hypothetical protein [Armatimonadota bacterium]
MKKTELLQQINTLQDKLNRALRRATGLREKSKMLEMQYEDARTREQNTNDIVGELLERQRELNVMLNRANIMLNRTQEAMALSSMELNEMAKALPEPKKAEWADRVSRVNELFKQTGIQDAELGALESGTATASVFDASDMKKQSQEAFDKKQSIWDFPKSQEPPQVQAEIVEEESQPEEGIHLIIEHTNRQESQQEPTIDSGDNEDGQFEEDTLAAPQPRKSWWRRLAL